ncbi:hypothetical protein Ae406Ps2_3963c [Pseudonocardia sp. Ae406_Ps2]|nr:hypothetical protein Ae331Ps2_1993 [Pseudonocardia sp. Ae331_Ps2]OLM03963.1 hypothetical protein Ae406Ps2_3963c [Pseudonocardia sp. Ae406_Ps2]OLM11211.1 hypothetical protein Ae505Ps2_1334 [Pseudonocardia sp. Ae505_Ps2]
MHLAVARPRSAQIPGTDRREQHDRLSSMIGSAA